MSTKRYQLFKVDSKDPTAVRPCAFFASDKGCKSGDACKFLHGANDTRHAAPVQQQATPSQPPTEESSKKRKHKKEKEVQHMKEEKKHKRVESAPPQQQQQQQQQPVQSSVSYNTQVQPVPVMATPASIQQQQQQPPKEKSSKKKRKEKHSSSQPVGGGAPALHSQQSSAQNAMAGFQLPIGPFSPNAVKTDDDDDASFLFGVVNTALSQGQVQSPPLTSAAATTHNNHNHNHHHNNNNNNNSSSSSSGDSNMFINRNSVGQRLQTSGTDHATTGSSSARKAKKSKALPVSLPATQANIAPALQYNAFSTFPIAQFNPNASQQQQQQQQQQQPPQQQQQQQQQQQHHQQQQQQQQQQSPPTVLIDERVINWRPFVQATVSCPRFGKEYDFEMDHTWVQAKPHGDWCKNLPPVVAIDCEMCETTDPVTGTKDSSTLIRFSMVNGLNPKEVIVDSLVNPLLPVSNMRNQIHGITEDALRNVQFTLRHAQAIMMNTISDRTVIVGHALHHDLKSLKFSHKCAVDTSYIYQVANEPGAAPGLRDCAQQCLSQTLSPLHDSVEDAQFALMLAAHVVSNGFQPPIVRVGGSGGGDNKAALMIHRVPRSCGEEQVKRMFAVNAYIIPKSVAPIQHPAAKDPTANVGKTDATFESVAHADLAFDTLPGPDRPDKSNRSQKRVYLQGGGYICVRKY